MTIQRFKVSVYISRCSQDRKGKFRNVCTFASVPISSSGQNNHKRSASRIKMTDIAAWGLAWLGWPLKGLFPSEGRDEDKNEPSKNHISCVFLTYLICDVSSIKFLVGNILLMAFFCDVFRSKANALNVFLSTTNNWATEQCRQSNVFTHFLFYPR